MEHYVLLAVIWDFWHAMVCTDMCCRYLEVGGADFPNSGNKVRKEPTFSSSDS